MEFIRGDLKYLLSNLIRKDDKVTKTESDKLITIVIDGELNKGDFFRYKAEILKGKTPKDYIFRAIEYTKKDFKDISRKLSFASTRTGYIARSFGERIETGCWLIGRDANYRSNRFIDLYLACDSMECFGDSWPGELKGIEAL